MAHAAAAIVAIDSHYKEKLETVHGAGPKGVAGEV
jgi:hypothetical protein